MAEGECLKMGDKKSCSFHDLLSCVSVYKFSRGDMIQMIDHDCSLFVLKKAEEPGYIIDFPGGYTEVTELMISDCPHFTDKEFVVKDMWDGGGVNSDEIIDNDFEVVYACKCPNAFYTRSDYNKWENDMLCGRSVTKKKIGRSYRPGDFPEYWDNGRCSMCGHLVVRREIKREEIKRWKEWKEKV